MIIEGINQRSGIDQNLGCIGVTPLSRHMKWRIGLPVLGIFKDRILPEHLLDLLNVAIPNGPDDLLGICYPGDHQLK